MNLYSRLKHQATFAATLLTCLLSIPQAVAAEDAAPTSIQFSDTHYHLVWQSNPNPDYSKYEYLPQTQQLPYYHNMMMLERLSNGMTTPQVVQSQVEFITQRKQTDPVAQHRLISNEATGEFLLDFLLSADDPEQGTIIEWNAYRYIPQQGENGDDDAVLLLGYSARAYGDEEGRRFLLDLQQSRGQVIQALVSSGVPQLNAPSAGADH